VLDHVQHPLQKAEGQSPDDMAIGITDDDTREADIGQLGNDVFDLARLVVKSGEGKPEGLLDFGRIEGEFLVLF